MKPALPPIDVPGSTPFQKTEMFGAVIAVPEAVIDKREKEWKRENDKKRKKRA
jgi:hypothetical protein